MNTISWNSFSVLCWYLSTAQDQVTAITERIWWRSGRARCITTKWNAPKWSQPRIFMFSSYIFTFLFFTHFWFLSVRSDKLYESMEHINTQTCASGDRWSRNKSEGPSKPKHSWKTLSAVCHPCANILRHVHFWCQIINTSAWFLHSRHSTHERCWSSKAVLCKLSEIVSLDEIQGEFFCGNSISK